MRRPHAALPAFLQVTILVVLGLIAGQAVAFGLILHAPPPEPAGFTLDQAALALQGEPAESADGRRLRRTLSAAPPIEASSTDPLVRVLTRSLEDRLGLPPGAVRVALAPPHGQMRHRLHARDEAPLRRGAEPDGRRQVLVLRQESRVGVLAAPGPAPRGEPGAAAETPRLSILAEHLRFPPFTVSARLADGRWATVRPPGAGLTPWHGRMLLGFLASLLLLAPLAWWLARRLTRPIQVFAEGAERLGADPNAPPLPVAGPAEVRNAAAAFNDMQDKLRRYVEGRTQMVAAIAHDLRTPLTRLRFRAEQAEPELRERMAADIEQMDGMIAQALAFVRGESVREARVRLDLAALAGSVCHDLAEIGASVDWAGGAAEVVGEPINLRRAVANLVENAVKYGGAARVRLATEGGRAVLTVEDEGPGLPEAELERVFEPFRRGEPSRSRATGGAGLGLTVARGVARAHGGEVSLANRPGGGLVARLELPLA